MASTPAATMDGRIPPMPPHWILDGDPESPKYNGSLMQKVVLIIHSGFCAVTIGAGNLRPLWERCNTNEPGAWEEGRNSLRERIQHTNIVVRSLFFQHGRPFSIFFRAVCSSQRSRLSVVPTHRRTLNSFLTQRRAPRVSCSSPSDSPSRVSSSDPQSCW